MMSGASTLSLNVSKWRSRQSRYKVTSGITMLCKKLERFCKLIVVTFWEP